MQTKEVANSLLSTLLIVLVAAIQSQFSLSIQQLGITLPQCIRMQRRLLYDFA